MEEFSELLDAIDAADEENIVEELGDLFFHLVMQAQISAEGEGFGLVDVLAGIDAKLKRRHPHVWGDWQVADTAEVLSNWEKLKLKEKGGTAVLRFLIIFLGRCLRWLDRKRYSKK